MHGDVLMGFQYETNGTFKCVFYTMKYNRIEMNILIDYKKSVLAYIFQFYCFKKIILRIFIVTLHITLYFKSYRIS